MDAVPELFEAIGTGDVAKVRELLDANADLANARNAQGQSAVLMACYMGRKEIRDLLLEKGPTLALHEAAAAGNLSRVKEIVEEKPELAKGHSPLLEAAANGRLDIVRTLAAHGADLHARTDAGKNALNFAEERGYKELAVYLREQ